MNPLIENALVVTILACALGYLLARFIRKRRTGKGCGSGCGCETSRPARRP